MSPCRHHRVAPCCNPVARATHLSAAQLVNLLGQGRGTHARFRRARPFVPERLRSCRVSRAHAHYRNAPCSVRADTRLALPVSPATHPSSPSRDDGHPPARPCYARNVTTALRGTTRETSDRPLQTDLFKEEDPEPFVDRRCRGFRRIRTDGTHGSRRTHRGSRLPSWLVRTSPFCSPRRSATSDAPRRRPTSASLAFALPSTAARPRPLSRRAREGHLRCDDPERLPTMDALLGPSAISRLCRRDSLLAVPSPDVVSHLGLAPRPPPSSTSR